jgi:hypothetical protein
MAIVRRIDSAEDEASMDVVLLILDVQNIITRLNTKDESRKRRFTTFRLSL